MKSYTNEILECITPIHNRLLTRQEKVQFLKDLLCIGQQSKEWLEIDKTIPENQ